MNKIKYIQVVTALLLMFSFSQCYYDQILDEPAEPLPDREISFQGDIVPIFDASCNSSGCHNTGGIAPDLTADKAYNALIAGNYIDTGVPENSGLYRWMAGRESQPMPLSGSDAAYNALVLKWITEGAKNN